jgi:methyltransferase (TIGR00027 family)
LGSHVKPNSASRTAQRVALRRAAHQLLDSPPVFADPLALRIIGGRERAALEADPAALDARRWDRSLRAFVAARSRYVEDELADFVAAGGRQYVVLGAGLDTFAYRNPHPQLRVFEVDYPATQEWKRERLDAAGIALPSSLVFAGVNFETDALSEKLRDAGLDAQAPAFCSWLGVVPYLGAQAVMETLRWVARLPAPSSVVFDYAVPPATLGTVERAAFNAVAARVAAAGEPWQTFFDPARLAGDLIEAGFRTATDLGPEAINRRYYEARTDGLKVSGSLGHLMKAQV